MTDAASRPGLALVLAILAVVIAGALIVATHSAVTLEHRVAAASVARQRAFAASEHALWKTVAEWDGSYSALAPGAALRRVVHSAADSAVVTTVRLSDHMYWLVAEASVGEARRRTGANVIARADSSGLSYRPVVRSWVDLR